MTITEFLVARLDEREAAAKAAPGNAWVAHAEDDVAGASVYDEQWLLLNPTHYDHDEPYSSRPGARGPMYIERARDQLADHIARHDPAHVLADVAAKRAIVARAEAYLHGPRHLEAMAAVRHLAAIDADHPDYRQEWQPQA